MHTILTVIFVLTTCVIVSAQQRYDDVVYLNNGDILRGRIIEVIPQKQLTIETVDRIVVVYQLGEVEKYYKRIYPAEKPGKLCPLSAKKTKKAAEKPGKAEKPGNSFNHVALKRGIHRVSEAGYSIGTSADDIDFIKLNLLIAGYRFSPYLFAGLGSGFWYYPNSVVVSLAGGPTYDYVDFGHSIMDPGIQHSSWGIPLFADFRLNLFNKKVTPYFSFDLGYTFIFSDPPSVPRYNQQPADPVSVKKHLNKGGVYLSTALGTSFKISRTNFMSISIGYEMQRMSIFTIETYNFWGGSAAGWQTTYYLGPSINKISNCISINSGISF